MSTRPDVIRRLDCEIHAKEAWWSRREAGKWATICERARYRCEYCNKDMLASRNDYLSMQSDHIVPKSDGGSDDVKNQALSCAPCNGKRLKGAWNPESVVGNNASRKQKIQAVKQYLKDKSADLDKILSKYRQIVGYPLSHQQCGCCE